MLNLQIEIFLLLAAGYILSYKGMLSSSSRSQLTGICLNFILPCAIIRSFCLDLTPSQLQQGFLVLLASTGIQLLYMLFNCFLWKKEPEDQQVNLRYATLVSNAGFMGMPIAQEVFGDVGLLYASLFLIPQRIVMWSAGISLYACASSKKQMIKQVAMHPCIIALEIGVIVLILRMCHVFLPVWLDDALKAAASCNTAMCMLVIGALLEQADKQDVFTKTTLLYAAVRLLILPAVILIVMKLCHMPALATGVCVLESAMPAASTTAMLADRYHQNPAYASKLIFVSTLLSLFTLPIVAWFLV